MKVCFIGHKTIEKSQQVKTLLKETALSLVKNGAKTFLFGSKGEFNKLSWEVITELKKEYPYIERVYVRSAFKNIEESYKKYLLEFYEKTYYPPKIENAGKYSYVERNYEMIDNSNCCVFYFNQDHVAQLNRNSGTKIAFDYAIKKKKQIINVFNTIKG